MVKEVDVSKLKHDKKKIVKMFSYSGDSILCNEHITVMYPTTFVNKKLVTIGSEHSVISYLAIINNGYYCKSFAPVMLPLLPDIVEDVIVGGKEYKQLHFNQGDVFIANKSVVTTASTLQNIVEEFMMSGNIPWYFNYRDMIDLLLESRKYAKSGIGDDILSLSLLAAQVCRSSKDSSIHYRELLDGVDSNEELGASGLSNVYTSYDNTLSKIGGGYYGIGVSTAIVKPEETADKVSELYRG